MKKFLLSGGALLGGSAVLSKFLGLWRDRLFLDIFGAGEKVDMIFASFRIPDFFFFLLVGGTISTLFLPRFTHLGEKEKSQFFSSFLWGVVVFFGIFCGLGVIFTESLTGIFAGGFPAELRAEMIPLSRMLFGSVFLLSVSSVFAALHQSRHQFLSIAIAPVLYTGGICAGLYFWRDTFGLFTVGIAAVSGAFVHLLVNMNTFFVQQNKVEWVWKKPAEAWKKFTSDFVFRVTNNAAFQINQSADILIASFLAVGTVGAFSIGTNLGSVLLSIVGMSIANSAFPRLAQAKEDTQTQRKVLGSSLGWILFFTIPVAIVGAMFPEIILRILFRLEGESLQMATIVFRMTVLSLPAMCVIPVLARVFLASGDAKTPMKITSFSLLIATGLAAVLALKVLPPESAIWGLAIGNFVASVLSAGIFGVMTWRKLQSKVQ
ncbi:oligosaccharide flippase family protein [Candidatus Gracilibacteria bacterium]|nr:oligosaccharide flippase family protein [Candidatus Gracilibacteria bacterium]